MLIVAIENQQDIVGVDTAIEMLIERAVCETLVHEGMDFVDEVDVLLVDNETIREINRNHRQKDKSTDVLSFPMYGSMEDVIDSRESPSPILLGDIVISLEQAVIQSEEFNHGIEREIAYLTVHSTLHLLGYDHMNEMEKTAMREKEESVMQRMGLGR